MEDDGVRVRCRHCGKTWKEGQTGAISVHAAELALLRGRYKPKSVFHRVQLLPHGRN